MTNGLRMLPASRGGASVQLALSELSALWCPADLENPAADDPARRAACQVPNGASGLDPARAQRSGNPASGEAGFATAGAGVVNRIVNRTREAWRMSVPCRRCGSNMAPGIAIEQTYTGIPDFPGDKVVTLWPGGPGCVIQCLKCPACGWSVANKPNHKDEQ